MPLLSELARLSGAMPLRVIVTENVPECPAAISETIVGELGFHFIANTSPKGFGANHNAAFHQCTTAYFCVLNPDIKLRGNPFPALIREVERCPGIAVPTIVSEIGHIEDSVRRIPTMSRLIARVLTRIAGAKSRPDYPGGVDMEVDWAAGMFMLFSADFFRRLRGFDERFHLYCEDVDICLRAWSIGGRVVRLANVSVLHQARRDSRRKLKYFAWHMNSILRLFLSRAYWNFRIGRHARTECLY